MPKIYYFSQSNLNSISIDMKKIKLLLLSVFSFAMLANAQELPQPSPFATVMQKVGLTDVTIEYSRPGVKEREIFGGLLAFDKVWRTGANAPTQFITSSDLTIDGKVLPAGTYSLLSIPGEEEWTVIFNKNEKASEGKYKQDEDALRVQVKPFEMEDTETMTFWFANVKEDQADLMFAWEDVAWKLPIKTSVDEMAMANIEKKMKEIEEPYGVYNASARYYLEHDKDLDQALSWSKKSVSISPEFWNVYTLSLIHHARGEYKEAIAAAERSLKIAEEIKYDTYIKLNKENIEKWKKESGKKK